MKKLGLKLFNIVTACILVMILLPKNAAADTSSDIYTTPKINGFTYDMKSMVWSRSNSNKVTLEAVAYIEASKNVDPGYMGAQARLYTSKGELWTASAMKYNTTKVAGIYAYSPTATAKDTYYALTYGDFYTGDGYRTFFGYKSPNMSMPSSKYISEIEYSQEILTLMTEEYAVNNNGETYGSSFSEFTEGEAPDLISAIGVNGVKGYIKSSDLAPKFTIPEEAITYTQSRSYINIIPVYDLDGITVLDDFELINY
ncbi:peptidase [Lysinibacillus sp. NPDC096212]|uniref:peptidase n=1 Tax=unclassified Lysinibacillus TaxID=2636778 RepID=UPI00382E0971